MVASLALAAGAQAQGYGGHGAAYGLSGYGGYAAPAYGHGGLAVAAAHAVPIAKAVVGHHYPPQPYKFGYDTVDEYGTKQSRHEVSDEHNNKQGSYSFTDAHGISRKVDYVADGHGFRASIHTNEPGTAPSAPAGAHYNAQPIAIKTPVLAKVAAAPIAAYAAAPYGHAGYGGHY